MARCAKECFIVLETYSSTVVHECKKKVVLAFIYPGHNLEFSLPVCPGMRLYNSSA